MAYTNSTPNYDLPQWIGSDKPDFLGDLDPAFLKIDETMKNNETSATGAESVANAANTKADNAVSTANSAVAQIGAVDTKADNAISTANNAQATANTANETANSANSTAINANNNAASALEQLSHFNLTESSNLTFSLVTGKGTITTNGVKIVTDKTQSIGKIYGSLNVSNAVGSSGTLSFKSNKIFNNVTSAYNITAAGFAFKTGNDLPDGVTIGINTDGTINLTCYKSADQQNTYINMLPYLFFFTNFGDTPISPNSL